MHETLNKIRALGIVPVVVIDKPDDAEPLAQALTDGGLPCAEITFRTAAAKEAMLRIAKKMPSMLLGAGTVLNVDQAKTAMDCGATFIVSPGLSKSVVEYCTAKGVAVIPGVVTPTEIGLAIDLGLEVVKFFPAEPSGGVDYLKALAGPFTTMKFIPTGGINKNHLQAYLTLPSVLACGGSWMVKSDLIKGGRFADIRKLSLEAIETIRSVRRQ